MAITVPKPPDLDDLHEQRDALNKKIGDARRRYERRVEKKLSDTTVDDIDTLDDVCTLLAAPGRRAYDLVEAWIKSLGSTDMRFDGILLDRDQNGVGPAVMITVPHPSPDYDDYAERFGGLNLALMRYVEFLRPVVESLNADGVTVKVMDNDLSASGIPEIRIRTDGSCEFDLTVRGLRRTQRSWDTLADALEWLAQNRWYGEPYASSGECW